MRQINRGRGEGRGRGRGIEEGGGGGGGGNNINIFSNKENVYEKITYSTKDLVVICLVTPSVLRRISIFILLIKWSFYTTSETHLGIKIV